MTQETPGAPIIRQLEKDIAAWKGRKAHREQVERIRILAIILIILLLCILFTAFDVRLP